MAIGKRVLITGTTGAIGSMHLLELLRRGYQVTCLIRGNTESDRFNKLASVVGHDAASQVKIIAGEIIKPLAGVEQEVIAALRGKIDVVIHHAGSIKFDRKWQEEIVSTNVGGTANMLSLAEALEIKYFCYDSTAYALNLEPRNPYEESKRVAESLVLDWRYGHAMVWRPSIVVGRSTDGVTNGFSGYYGFFSGFSHLKYQLAKQWETDQQSCREQGFEFDGAGTLTIFQPIYIDYSRTSTLNLIPVDWAVSVMTNCLESNKWDTSYNIVNNNPPRVAWIIERSFEILAIKGVKRLSLQELQLPVSDFWAEVQQSINSHLERFWSYINYEMAFVSDVAEPSPIVDQHFLQKMMAYAIDQKFGHKDKRSK